MYSKLVANIPIPQVPEMRLFSTCLILVLSARLASAGIVSTTFDGDVLAEYDGASDSATSSLSTDTISAFTSADNSFTQSDLNWAWDGSELSGSTLLTLEKTVAPKPGGPHHGNSVLTFDFTIDESMAFQIDGTFGFADASGGDDSVGYVLTGPSGTVSSGSAALSNGGIAGETFSDSGVITTGSYTLTFTTDMSETINNLGTSLAGFELTGFSITPLAAVPEPSSLCLLLTAIPVACRRRWRVAFRNA